MISGNASRAAMAGLTAGGSGSDCVGVPWSDASKPEPSLALRCLPERKSAGLEGAGNPAPAPRASLAAVDLRWRSYRPHWRSHRRPQCGRSHAHRHTALKDLVRPCRPVARGWGGFRTVSQVPYTR